MKKMGKNDMQNDNLAKCGICGKRIRFIKLLSGKAMPVDEYFVPYKKCCGKDRLVTPDGDVIACSTQVNGKDADGYGFIPHFATCGKQK